MADYLLEGKEYALPYNSPQAQAVLEVVAPCFVYADWTNVVTATTSLQSTTITVGTDIWLQSLNILVSSDAVTNGVSVCIVITSGNRSSYFPTSATPTTNGGRNVGAIFNINVNPPYGQFVANGGTIRLFFIATGGASTLQLLASGIFAGGIT